MLKNTALITFIFLAIIYYRENKKASSDKLEAMRILYCLLVGALILSNHSGASLHALF